VVNVLTFDTLDEAIGVVNASVNGLQASIFTSDLRSVLYAHARLEVGALVHDEATAFRVDAQTYGGVKESGLGREGPRHAVLEYTEPRLLVVGAPGMR
jgi:acyl-CoA reductase-like NAD-dependent aldehyde dehydrogenase